MIYLITYDKNSFLKNYDPLREGIKSCSISWWHHMNNTWLIHTNMNANQIYNRLRFYITPKDKLLIIQIQLGADYQGWLNDKAWSWLKKQPLSAYQS